MKHLHNHAIYGIISVIPLKEISVGGFEMEKMYSFFKLNEEELQAKPANRVYSFFALNENELEELRGQDNADFEIENGVLIEYKGHDAKVRIPDNVTGIDKFAFEYNEIIKEIVIPDSLTEICEGAFASCVKLQNLRISPNHPCLRFRDGVLFDIRKKTLLLCTERKSGLYQIPDKVTVIGDNAFSNCDRLTKIVIPDSVTRIGDEAFSDCTELTEINIPKGLKEHGVGIFERCNNLKFILIPSSHPFLKFQDGFLINIKTKTLVFCVRSKSGKIRIPDGIEIIGTGAFWNCFRLTNVIIPKGVKKIESFAFYGCGWLTEIVIPSSITEVGAFAFEFTNLKSVIISHKLYYHDSSFPKNCNIIRRL